MSKIINKLKAFRLSRGMTQRELAEKLGMFQEQISFIESGNRGKNFNKKRLETLKEMGYNDSVTDNIEVDMLSKAFDECDGVYKADNVIEQKNNYFTKQEFLKNFLNAFGIDIFISVKNNNLVFKAYYKKQEIFCARKKEDYTLSTLK